MKKWLMFGVLLLLINTASAFIASGKTTLSSAQGLDKIGFIFNTGEVVGNDGDIYYYEDSLWTNHLEAGLKDMGKINVKECDLGDYEKEVDIVAGNTYCVKTQDGGYAKIAITEKTDTTLKFDWQHQRDGSNLFVEEGDIITQELNFSPMLIGIIIILIVLILILWKFR